MQCSCKSIPRLRFGLVLAQIAERQNRLDRKWFVLRDFGLASILSSFFPISNDSDDRTMKSERGQTHEANLLADKFDQQLGVLRQYLPAIILIIAAAIIALLAYGIYSTQSQTHAARGWTDWYFSDTQTQNLESIAKDFPTTTAAQWAHVTAGDANTAKALERWFLDRNLAEQFFKQAAEDYRAAITSSSDAFVKSRAQFGLAQALEGLGSSSEAIAEYRKIELLTGIAPEFIGEAKKRVAWLESKDGETFFTWYKTNRPHTPVLNEPSSKLPDPSALPNIDFAPVKKPDVAPATAPTSEPVTTPDTSSGETQPVPPTSAPESSSGSAPAEAPPKP